MDWTLGNTLNASLNKLWKNNLTADEVQTLYKWKFSTSTNKIHQHLLIATSVALEKF